MAALFPEDDTADLPPEEIPDITEDWNFEGVTVSERNEAAKKLKPNKALGPDRIPLLAVRYMVHAEPGKMKRLVNVCLEMGYWSAQ